MEGLRPAAGQAGLLQPPAQAQLTCCRGAAVVSNSSLRAGISRAAGLPCCLWWLSKLGTLDMNAAWLRSPKPWDKGKLSARGQGCRGAGASDGLFQEAASTRAFVPAENSHLGKRCCDHARGLPGPWAAVSCYWSSLAKKGDPFWGGITLTMGPRGGAASTDLGKRV